MCTFKVRELSTDYIYTVYDTKKTENKTYFLIWKDDHWKYVDIRKFEPIEGHFGG